MYGIMHMWPQQQQFACLQQATDNKLLICSNIYEQ